MWGKTPSQGREGDIPQELSQDAGGKRESDQGNQPRHAIVFRSARRRKTNVSDREGGGQTKKASRKLPWKKKIKSD